jgi:hypothetical protein
MALFDISLFERNLREPPPRRGSVFYVVPRRRVARAGKTPEEGGASLPALQEKAGQKQNGRPGLKRDARFVFL